MSAHTDPRDRAGVVTDLGSPDEDVRRLAVERASFLPSDEGLPMLAAQLGDPSWRVRKAVVAGIVASPDVGRATAALIEALSDSENPGRRNSAVEALIAGGSERVPALLVAATDPDSDVRKFAVDALAGIGNLDAVAGLVQGLTDADANVRAAAADALAATHGTEGADALLARAVDSAEDLTVRFSALRALGALQHPVSSSELTGVLDDATLRAAGFESLGRVEADAGAVEALLKGLRSNSRAHREAAIGGLLRALAHQDGAEEAQTIRQIRDVVEPAESLLSDAIERLDEADADLRLCLIQFLGLVGDDSVVVPLLRCVRERDFAEVASATLVRLGATAEHAIGSAWESVDAAARRDACGVLALTRGPAGAERLVAALSDIDPDVRLAAAAGIGRRRLVSALGALLNRLEELSRSGAADSEDEGRALVAAVVAVGADPQGADATHALIAPRLRDWLSGSEDTLRLAVAVLLAGLGREEDAELIELLLRDPSARVRRAAVDAVVRLDPAAALEPLHLALADDAPRVRMAAVMALGASDVASALDDLARLADDEDVWVRSAAVRSLGARFARTGDTERGERVFAVLEKALDDEVLVALGAVEALHEIGGADARRVMRLLERAEPELVKEAIVCLEAHAPTAELDVLLPLVEHPEWSVRAEATRVLGTRGVVRALPAILARVQDEQDEFVRETVLATLKRLDA